MSGWRRVVTDAARELGLPVEPFVALCEARIAAGLHAFDMIEILALAERLRR